MLVFDKDSDELRMDVSVKLGLLCDDVIVASLLEFMDLDPAEDNREDISVGAELS